MFYMKTFNNEFDPDSFLLLFCLIYILGTKEFFEK